MQIEKTGLIEKNELTKKLYAVALMGSLLLAVGCNKAPEPEAALTEKPAQAVVADIQSVKDMDMAHELFGPGAPDQEEFHIKAGELDFKRLGSGFAKEARGSEFLVSPWFRRDVSIGTDHYHVAFIQLQQLDETGEPRGAHADSSAIAAITYKKTPEGWIVASRQKSPFTLAGSWGMAPKPEDDAVKYLVPSPGLTMLLVPTYYSNQGYAEEGVSLLAFDGQSWADVGHLDTGGDNAGVCSDADDAELEEDWKPCWSYTGKVAMFASDGGKYPDIIVIHSGTAGSDAGEMNVVPNDIFSFKKGQYSKVSDK